MKEEEEEDDFLDTLMTYTPSLRNWDEEEEEEETYEEACKGLRDMYKVKDYYFCGCPTCIYMKQRFREIDEKQRLAQEEVFRKREERTTNRIGRVVSIGRFEESTGDVLWTDDVIVRTAFPSGNTIFMSTPTEVVPSTNIWADGFFFNDIKPLMANVDLIHEHRLFGREKIKLQLVPGLMREGKTALALKFVKFCQREGIPLPIGFRILGERTNISEYFNIYR